MKIKNPFKYLSKFEWALWVFSMAVTIGIFCAFPNKDWTVLVSSTVGVTSLIFCAKGMVFGQIVGVIFSIFYAVVSFSRGYYGEMITYLGMNTPMAIFSVITWVRNPYQQTEQVKVRQMKKKQVASMVLIAAAVTAAFYFILKALDTNQLIISTTSIATSFVPAYMMMMRSPSYAWGYAANDIVLIALWTVGAISDTSCIPMIACFVMFLMNDLYAVISWHKMKEAQENA